jgi:hypothetical protein
MTYTAPFAYAMKSITNEVYAPAAPRPVRRRRRRRLSALRVAR